jgi:hypothetical protein
MSHLGKYNLLLFGIEEHKDVAKYLIMRIQKDPDEKTLDKLTHIILCH